jgi:hypothetical protein
MKKLTFVLFFAAFGLLANAQTAQQPASQHLNAKVVEIACGECKFKMEGKSCDLAIRVDGISYFVDGKTVDDFGDAHAKHGFCNARSQAVVTGELVNGRFKAKTITLVPAKKKHG